MLSVQIGDRVKRNSLQGEFIVVGLGGGLAVLDSGPISRGCSVNFQHSVEDLTVVRKGEFVESYGYLVRAY